MIVNQMTGRVLTLASALACLAPSQGPGDVDLFLLTRAVRAEVSALRTSAPKRPEALKRGYLALANRDADSSRPALMQALAELRGLAWTGALESAAAYRLVPGETVVEPGGSVHAALEMLQRAAHEPPEAITATITLRNEKGMTVFKSRSRDAHEITGAELSVPAPKEECRCTLLLELKDTKSEALVAEARATVWVVGNVRARLRGIGARAEALAIKNQSAAQAVWVNTVLAIVDRFSAALGSSIRPAAQSAAALTQTLVPTAEVEPLNPTADLAWAERTVGALEAGGDPAKSMEGWIPLGIRSHKDLALRLARVWWPRGKPAGLVVLLGDSLYHDRSWSGARFDSFIALSPSARPGATGWSEGTWLDIEDWIAALASVTGIEHKTQFVLAYGAGAGDAAQLVAKTPSRFPAVAFVAGTPDMPLTGLPKDLPPLMLVEAGKDTFVPTDELRRAGIIFQRRMPAAFEYAVAPAETHDSVRDAILPRVLEFFSSVSSGTWKPSGTPVPLPGRARQ